MEQTRTLFPAIAYSKGRRLIVLSHWPIPVAPLAVRGADHPNDTIPEKRPFAL